jgi:hypothetical protein
MADADGGRMLAWATAACWQPRRKKRQWHTASLASRKRRRRRNLAVAKAKIKEENEENLKAEVSDIIIGAAGSRGVI